MSAESAGRPVSMEEGWFFQEHSAALPVYLHFREQMLEKWPDVQIRTARTQISFFLGYMVCCVSFLPLGRRAERPETFLTVSFGLDHELREEGISAAVRTAPERWTHHVRICSAEDMNDAFWEWIRMAAVFSMRKGRRGK